MHGLHEDDIAISGFAAVRERVLLLDRTFFKQVIPDECMDGFGGCVYLANAWFSPRGDTGLHHHTGLDIVSLIPRGSILHKGTLGDGVEVVAGQVQIQRDGGCGFSHNEINPNNQIQPMIQLWINPLWPVGENHHAPAPEYQVLDVHTGLTCVYGGDLFAAPMRVDVLHWPDGGDISFSDETLLYVCSGQAQIREGKDVVAATRGTLLRGKHLHVQTNEALQLLVIRHPGR